jgi:hypothetical protein
MCHDVMDIQFVQYWIRILGNCRETSMEVIKDVREEPCSDLL